MSTRHNFHQAHAFFQRQPLETKLLISFQVCLSFSFCLLLIVLDVVFCFHSNKSPNRSPTNPQKSFTTVVLQCRNGEQTVPTLFDSMRGCYGYGTNTSMSNLSVSLPLRMRWTLATYTHSSLRMQGMHTHTTYIRYT